MSAIVDTVSLPKLIFKHFHKIGLKPNEFYFYSYITYLESTDKPIPSQDELASMMGFSERQLKQIISSLKKKGFLTVNRSRSVGKKYDFKLMLESVKRSEIQTAKSSSFILLMDVDD